VLSILDQDANYNLSVFGAFLCNDFMLLKPRHVSVTQDHLQWMHHSGGKLYHSRGWLRYYATSWKVTGSISDVFGFYNRRNPSSRTMALGSTQPLTEMNTRNLLGGKEPPARKAHNLTAICEPTV
jgi:hypothetical protein